MCIQRAGRKKGETGWQEEEEANWRLWHETSKYKVDEEINSKGKGDGDKS